MVDYSGFLLVFSELSPPGEMKQLWVLSLLPWPEIITRSLSPFGKPRCQPGHHQGKHTVCCVIGKLKPLPDFFPPVELSCQARKRGVSNSESYSLIILAEQTPAATHFQSHFKCSQKMSEKSRMELGVAGV